MSKDIAERFAREITEHEMTVLHDDGLYRHLRFTPVPKPGKPQHSFYWFDLITVPGTLIFQGDGESFVFRRTTDMFEFFRGSAWCGQPNYQYWAEKIVDGCERAQRYSEDLFRQRVIEAFVDDARSNGVPLGTGRALREQVLDSYDYDLQYEENARRAINDFEHKGYRFEDAWEWDLRDWGWWFQWACHAIVWGIAYYDTGKRPVVSETRPAAQRKAAPEGRRIITPGESPAPALPAVQGPVMRPVHAGRSVVDVQLPEPVSTN